MSKTFFFNLGHTCLHLTYSYYKAVYLNIYTAFSGNSFSGTSDYFGVNHYTTELVVNGTNLPSCVSYRCDQDVDTYKNESWPGLVTLQLSQLLTRYQYIHRGCSEHIREEPSQNPSIRSILCLTNK